MFWHSSMQVTGYVSYWFSGCWIFQLFMSEDKVNTAIFYGICCDGIIFSKHQIQCKGMNVGSKRYAWSGRNWQFVGSKHSVKGGDLDCWLSVGIHYRWGMQQ